MRKFGYIEANDHLPRRTFAWFHGVRAARLIRQCARDNPGRLAVLFAEAHLEAVRW